LSAEYSTSVNIKKKKILVNTDTWCRYAAGIGIATCARLLKFCTKNADQVRVNGCQVFRLEEDNGEKPIRNIKKCNYKIKL
jgi:hypothetical protein